MCLVIDSCCIAAVFDPENKLHARYAPVLAWISAGKGRMIYGGTKYARELREMKRYLSVISELERSRRLIRIPDKPVDTVARELTRAVSDPAFNDEHIASLVIASGCRVVCTSDGRAEPFLTRRELYAPYGAKRPRIYKSADKHSHLCCDRNVTGQCLRGSAREAGRRATRRYRRSGR